MFAVIGLVAILMGATATAIAVGCAILFIMKTNDEIRNHSDDPRQK